MEILNPLNDRVRLRAIVQAARPRTIVKYPFVQQLRAHRILTHSF